MLEKKIFKPRPPSCPNKPPQVPGRLHSRGIPVPINANLLVTGTAMAGKGSQEETYKLSRSKLRPRSATADKNIIKTLKRSPSVDDSFYDRFERLDRDWVEGDRAFKEKGGRIKTDRKDSAKIQSVSSRPKSASSKTTNSLANSGKNKHIPERPLNLAIPYGDNDTNVKPMIKKRVKSANLSRQDGRKRSRIRPSSGIHKSRERSISRKRSERSDSKSMASVGSGSRCSSRTGKNRRAKARKSRSRTRRETPRYNNFGSTSRNSPERKPSLLQNNNSGKVISAKVVVETPQNNTSHNEGLACDKNKRILSANLLTPSGQRRSSNAEILSKRRVLSANVVKLRVDLKQLRDSDHACVDAGLVRVSKEISSGRNREKISTTASMTRRSSQETHGEVTNLDGGRRTSAEIPRLKMIVGPTATPTFLKTLSFKTNLANAYNVRKRNV